MRVSHTSVKEFFTLLLADNFSLLFLGLSQQVDVLAFWKKMEVRWPQLSAIARDYLPTPETSVGVERVLNSGRDVVS